MEFVLERIVKQRTAEIMVVNLPHNTFFSPERPKLKRKFTKLPIYNITSILPNSSEQNSSSLQEQSESVHIYPSSNLPDSTLFEQTPIKQSRKSNGGKKHRHRKTLRKISRKYTRKHHK